MTGDKWRSWLTPASRGDGAGWPGAAHPGGRPQPRLHRGDIRERLTFNDDLGPKRHCVTPSLHAFAVQHLSFPRAWVAQLSHTLYLLIQGFAGGGQLRYV